MSPIWVGRFVFSSRPAVAILVCALALACSDGSVEPVDVAASNEPEAHTLDGIPLYAPPLADDVRRQREQELEDAHRDWQKAPADLDATIWYGRRTAYLGRYREAIDIYSKGLDQHPDNHLLLRHRGHRWISVRELDNAVEDLELAAQRIADLPDEVEPDGLPNARNTPTSTSHSNIWYHLGLAYYLQGDFEDAARCYRECMRFSKNPDMLCATSHWLYMTLRRLGRDDEAQALLDPIHADLDVIENHAYHRLLLLYKGELGAEAVLPEEDGDGIQSATAAYGVARWHLANGRPSEGTELLRRIVEGEQWAAFGHIAAEADLVSPGRLSP